MFGVFMTCSFPFSLERTRSISRNPPGVSADAFRGKLPPLIYGEAAAENHTRVAARERIVLTSRFDAGKRYYDAKKFADGIHFITGNRTRIPALPTTPVDSFAYGDLEAQLPYARCFLPFPFQIPRIFPLPLLQDPVKWPKNSSIT
jgi:hypothetical protein